MSINSSPELRGESAIAFMEEAEKNGQLPTPRLSPERQTQIEVFLKKSKDFVFPPNEAER